MVKKGIQNAQKQTPAGVYRPDLDNGRTPNIASERENQPRREQQQLKQASFSSSKPLPVKSSEPSTVASISNPLSINNSPNGNDLQQPKAATTIASRSDGDSSDDSDGAARLDCTASDTASPARIDFEELFASLYLGVPYEDGLKASRSERMSEGYGSVSLTYGEISAPGVRKGAGGGEDNFCL